MVAGFVRFFLFSTSQRISRQKSALIPPNNSFQSIPNTLNNSNPQETSNINEYTPSNRTQNSSDNVGTDQPDLISDTFSRLITELLLNDGSRQPESMDWFNVLLAQIINQYRSDARVNGHLVNWLNGRLNDPKKPDILDDIKITELNVGEDFPIFSNCRVHNTQKRDVVVNAGNSLTDSGSQRQSTRGQDQFLAEMDIDLSDTITLGIETRVKLNQSRWFNTVMPVSLTVSVVRFSARMKINITRGINKNAKGNTTQEDTNDNQNPENERNTKISLCISFDPNFTLDIAVKSLLGARSRLQDMPRIEHIIEGLLRKWFADQFVDPSYREIVLFRYNTL